MGNAGEQPEKVEIGQILQKMREQEAQSQRQWRRGVAIQLIAIAVAATIAIGLQGDAMRVQHVENWWYWSFGAGFILVVGLLLAICLMAKASSKTGDQGSQRKPEDLTTLDEKILLRQIRDGVWEQGTKIVYEVKHQGKLQEKWMSVTMIIATGIALLVAGFVINVSSGRGAGLAAGGFVLIVFGVVWAWCYEPKV
jgi:hypothetical protein